MPATVTLKLSIPRTNLVLDALRSYQDEQERISKDATDMRARRIASSNAIEAARTLADLEAQG